MLPAPAGLKDKAAEIWRSAAELKGPFPEMTLTEIAGVVRSMNGYYSNLIEGHTTRPIEIEAALKKRFSLDSDERNRQMLHLAHLETLERRKRSSPPPLGFAPRSTSADFTTDSAAGFPRNC